MAASVGEVETRIHDVEGVEAGSWHEKSAASGEQSSQSWWRARERSVAQQADLPASWSMLAATFYQVKSFAITLPSIPSPLFHPARRPSSFSNNIMGWFWADAEPKGVVAPHPLPRGSDASPPVRLNAPLLLPTIDIFLARVPYAQVLFLHQLASAPQIVLRPRRCLSLCPSRAEDRVSCTEVWLFR